MNILRSIFSVPDAEQTISKNQGMEVTVNECAQELNFERIYAVTVGDGFKIRVRMKWFCGGRRNDYSSTVTQRDGKQIGFDLHSVADKIIDRDLYPLVQDAADAIIAMDREIEQNPPRRFTDTHGNTWVRQ